MKIIIPILNVQENDGFKNDCLQRSDFGKQLTDLVENSPNQPLVISLDGAWGEGKTTFIKMWQGMLKEREIASIYVDAFANDYSDEPFWVVANAIMNYVKDDNKNFNIFINAAKKVGTKLIPFSAKILTKILTFGAINYADFELIQKTIRDDIGNNKNTDNLPLRDIDKYLAKDTSDLFENLIQSQLEKHSEKAQSIQSFKQILTKISIEKSGNKPLVIIIDELDRCKPTFAIELIEKIKHLFLVENVIFILAVNKQQLEESVKCVYGQNIDAHLYLQKFLNIETALPKKMTSNTKNGDLRIYSEKLFDLHEYQSHIENKIVFLDIIDTLCKHFKPSLRQLEKIHISLVLFYLSSNRKSIDAEEIIVFVAFIKVLKPRIFGKILASENTILTQKALEDIREELNWGEFHLSQGQFFNPVVKKIDQWVNFSLFKSKDKNLANLIDHYHLKQESLLSYFAQIMSSFSRF